MSAARQPHGILTLPQHQVGGQEKFKKQIKYYKYIKTTEEAGVLQPERGALRENKETWQRSTE